MTATTELAYSIPNLRVGGSGAFTPHVRVHCGNCTNRLEFPCNHSRPPEMIAKAVRHKGWEFDLYNRRTVRCPDCIKLRAVARQGESPGAKSFVELFGRKVGLPTNLVPEDAPTLPPEPAPLPLEPAPHPRAYMATPPITKKPEPKQATIVKPAPKPEPALPESIMQIFRDYRIELRTDRSLVELVTALHALGDVNALVLTKTEEIEHHTARLPAPSPEKPEPRKPAPTPAPQRAPAPSRNGPKSPAHRAAIQAALSKRAAEHQAKVRSAIDEIRRTAPGGRKPAIHEYIRELNAMGLKPYSRSTWSEQNVLKHLASLDNA